MSTGNKRANEFFVGREQELLELDRIFTDVVANRRSRVALVQGDYGTGKTAIVEEFLDRTRPRYDDLISGRGQFTMEKNSGGYGAFATALSGMLERSKSLSTFKGNVGEFIMKVAPQWISLIPVVGPPAGAIMTTVDSVLSLATPVQRYSASHIENQYVNALRELSARRPAVLFLDDLQWADESSLALLNRIANTIADQPLFVIIAYRQVEALETGATAATFGEMRANLLERLDAVEILLESGLDKNGIDVGQYVQRRYGANLFPDELAPKVQVHTRGHALFVSQVFSWWEEQGVIVRESVPGESWWRMSATYDLSAPLPSRVGEIIDERIRRLSEEMQEILRYASVQGELFIAQAICAALEMRERTFVRDMSLLEKNYRLLEYVNQTEAGDRSVDLYQFLHRYFRDRIYRQFGPPERRVLHREVAECLERIYSSNTAPIAGQLVRHYSEAGIPAKALVYSVQAAKYELSRLCWLEARQWGLEGLEILGNMQDGDSRHEARMDLLESIAEACYWTGRYQEAEEYFRKALVQAATMEIAPARLLTLYGHLAWCSTDWDEGLQIALKGLELVKNGTIPLGDVQVEFMCILGKTYYAVDDTENALAVLRATLDDVEKLGASPGLMQIKADILHKLGQISFEVQGQYRLSEEYYRGAIAVSRQIGSGWAEAQALVGLSEVLIHVGKLDEAETVLIRGIEIAAQQGYRDTEIDGYGLLGDVKSWQKNHHAAISLYKRAIRQAMEIGYIWDLQYYYADLAQAHLQLGSLDQAREAIDKSLEHAAGNEYDLAYVRSIAGRIKACDKQYDEAESDFRTSLEYYDREPAPWRQAVTKMHYANMLAEKGENERARDLLTASRTLFVDRDLNHMVHEVDALLAKLI